MATKGDKDVHTQQSFEWTNHIRPITAHFHRIAGGHFHEAMDETCNDKWWWPSNELGVVNIISSLMFVFQSH